MTQAFSPGAVVTSAFHPKAGQVPLATAKPATFAGLRALAHSGFKTVTVAFAGGRTNTFALTLA